MIALAAIRYETDTLRAQQLAFVSTLLIETHEQDGAQGHFDKLNEFGRLDLVESFFIVIEMGDTEIRATSSVYDSFGLSDGPPFETISETPPFVEDLFWFTDFMGEDDTINNLDPSRSGADRNVEFDSSGFDVNFGTQETTGVDVREISGIDDVPVRWADWRLIAGSEDFRGSEVQSWFEWEDRMWYLLNLTRVGLLDRSIELSPEDLSLNGVAFLTEEDREMLELP